MKSLTTLEELSIRDILAILDRAEEFKVGKYEKKDNRDKVIANLFFENSSRTLYSFVMAEKMLGYDNIIFNTETSSVKKGETLYDTVRLFEELGYAAVVIRSSEEGYYKKLEGLSIPILNGGDGAGAHPTQSLLDLMTIREEFGRFEGLKVLIDGDIKNSRVAKTNIGIMRRLGMDIKIAAPDEFKDCNYDYIDNINDLSDFDVVMLLRVQHERHGVEFKMDSAEYLEKYGLDKPKYNTLKDRAIIMHPAPFNRGWEIDSDLAKALSKTAIRTNTPLAICLNIRLLGAFA